MDNDKLRVEVAAPRIADALDGINEKMGRFIAHLDKSSRDNDKWLEGRVTIDARTHMVLLEAVQKLSGQFDKWFEFQTSQPDAVYLRELAEKVMNIPIMHGVDLSDAERLDQIARRLEKK